ncbi:hypothetical protein ACI78V_02140 [Geodermatophilus sp. SYSU D00742]
MQARVEAFVGEQYLAGRSLRELSELGRHGIHRRSAGAAPQHAGTAANCPEQSAVRVQSARRSRAD